MAVAVLSALQPTLRLQNEDYTVRNPLGVAGIPDPEDGVLGAVLLAVLLVCMAAAAALLATSQLLTSFLLADGELNDVLFGLAVAFVPIAAGIAILRYRLYEIDLGTLAAELLAGVDQTVEPTTVSLWLRPSAPRP